MVMRRLRIFVFALAFCSCEERVDLPIKSEKSNLLVVEGLVTNELRNHRVKLSLPRTGLNGMSAPVTQASVYLFEDTTNVYGLTEFPQGSGEYYTPMLRGLFGKLYTLYIVIDGKSYFARDSPVPVQPLRALDYFETPEGNALNLNPVGDDANYVEHLVTWEHTDKCVEENSCTGRIIYYDLKTIDVNEMFKPNKEQFYFPDQSVIVRRKYSVSPAYKAFLRSMLSETEWRGGVFDVQRSNVQSNLSEGATGFFAVCSVVSETTLVN